MKFSVIIPVYNKGPYVVKALESVLGQTFRNFEIIVVDDGSADDSFAKAKAALEGAPVAYRLLRQPNSGVSTARNNGVAASSGDYICFLDADDWWEKEFLEKMDGLIRDYPEAGIYGTNYFYVKNGRSHVCIGNVETGYINYCRVYAQEMVMPLTSISVAIPRHVFDEMGGFRPHLKLGEDFDLWIKIALKYKVAFLNEALSNYYQDSDAAWRGVGHLVNPKHHMLWNLDYLSETEKTNPDYKQLIDNLRTYSLFPYYLSKEYREDAKRELEKVDWKKQPPKVRTLYREPIFYLKARNSFLKFGVKVKQWLIKHL